MRYLAIIALAFLGTVELLIRFTLTLVLAISFIGIMALLVMDADADDLLKPFCFDLCQQLAEQPEGELRRRAAELERREHAVHTRELEQAAGIDR